jgi:hypothetical protein
MAKQSDQIELFESTETSVEKLHRDALNTLTEALAADSMEQISSLLSGFIGPEINGVLREELESDSTLVLLLADLDRMERKHIYVSDTESENL